MEIAVHSHTFAADSVEDVMANYYPNYARQMDRIGRERHWPGSYSRDQFTFGMSPEGVLYMGDPNMIAEKIIATTELFGLTRFIAHIDIGGPTHKEMMHSIELLGNKVFPQVRKAMK